jgi:tetratricopeptide (TPR) repeat protein
MIIDEASTSIENQTARGSQVLYVGYKALYRIYDAVTQRYIVTERDSMYLKIDGSWQSGTIISDSQVQEIWHDVIRRAGGRFMKKTVPQWETTARYYIIPSGFYPDVWNTAAYYATRGNWDEAMKIWGKLATSNTGKTAAYAAFNMALGAEMINEYTLALDWLDLADKYAPLTYTTVYRQHIQNRIEEVKNLNTQMNY